MFRRITQVSTINLRTAQSLLPQRYQSTNVADNVNSSKWDLYAGVLVERLPVVSKSLSTLEQQFQELLWRVEYENSLKSNHELQHERDQLQIDLIKKGQVEVDLDDSAAKQTAQDLKDAYMEEFKKFQFASRTTPDDASNKTTSTDRCLENTLYLLVQQKLGDQKHFLLPQGQRQEGETMRQTAERVLRENCGDSLKVQFYGNAPVGFYKYKYPSALRQKSQGAKVFFYRAALSSGNIDSKAAAPKFEWLTKAALDGKLKNQNYVESIKKFLLE